MNISDTGIQLIKDFEGCKLEAYRCSAGRLTIGYGHTARVREGDTCTQEEAEAFLREDLITVQKCLTNLLHFPVTQNQWDALSSFVLNLGCGALRTSTLLLMLNEGNDDAAAKQFARWDHEHHGNKLVVNAGLTRRRKAEAELFTQNG